MTLLGGEGLARLARTCHLRTRQLIDRLSGVPSVRLINESYFNEVALLLPRDAREVVRELADRQVLGGVSLGRLYPKAEELHRGLLVAATECTTDEDIEAFAVALGEALA